MDFTAWHRVQPDHGRYQVNQTNLLFVDQVFKGEREDCIEINWPHQGSSGWNDINCDRSDRGEFVCKKGESSQSPAQAPSTAAPTTVAPTTADPTTVAPTTADPTTVAPTTADPTTVAPTTADPTTVAPTTADPATVAPTTADPTTVSPTTTTTTTTTTAPATCPTPCPSGWSEFEGDCYKYFNDEKTWEAAREQCLAEEVFQFLKNY